MRQLVSLSFAGGALLLAACAALLGNQDAEEELPPFETRPVAWSLLVEERVELHRPSKGAKGRLAESLARFYAVVDDPREDPDARERRQDCAKAWAGLSRASRSTKALAKELTLAQGYLGVECGKGYARRSVALLTRFTHRHKRADLVYYSARFWLAEAYLELNQTSQALTQYRYVLGELESPLYPLALLRTAHCHWDQGEADQARTNMQYVLDWIGDRTAPIWVRSLKRRVTEDLRGFEE